MRCPLRFPVTLRNHILLVYISALGLSLGLGFLSKDFHSGADFAGRLISLGAVCCVWLALTALLAPEKESSRVFTTLLVIVTPLAYAGAFAGHISPSALLDGALLLQLGAVMILVYFLLPDKDAKK